MSRDGQAGFTLLEALAAVAILAAILAGISTIAGQWMPRWRHGFAALQNADLVGLALDRMAQDISAAEYARLETGKGPPLFRGEPDAVAFVRPAIGPAAGPRLEVVRIGESETPGGREVQRAAAEFLPNAVGGFRDAVTLLRPPFRLSLSYAGPDGRWRPRWSGETKLPRAVRLQVNAGAGPPLAVTAVALKVTAGAEFGAAREGKTPGASASDADP